MPALQSDFLVDPAWIEARLGDPKLRIFDCTLTRVPQPSGASLWESGNPAWRRRHVPGAAYVHMIDDLCDPDGPFPMTVANQGAIIDLLSRHGVANDTTVVVYGSGAQMVVHRAWWVLKISGVADVRVLDGGFERWIAEDRPVDSGEPSFDRATFEATREHALIADRNQIAAVLDNSGALLVHALSEEQFRGTGGQVYGRPGRIPGSINLPATSLIDPASGCFRAANDIRAAFRDAGIEPGRKLIPYCGGGIAASTVFLALTIAGYDDVALYDGSLLDWASDPAAPMTTGPEEEPDD